MTRALQRSDLIITTGGNTVPSKNTALLQFHFTMRDSGTHLPKTGVTGITGEIAKDGGAFIALASSISEVANGVYRLDSGLTAAELNADVVTLRFSETSVDDTLITMVTSV